MLACCLLGLLFADWASGCYVRCGCIGSPDFSFLVDGDVYVYVYVYVAVDVEVFSKFTFMFTFMLL